jgi:hypothetical protein
VPFVKNQLNESQIYLNPDYALEICGKQKNIFAPYFSCFLLHNAAIQSKKSLNME